MKNTSRTLAPSPAAQSLAANFQVAELEPRHENAWAGGSDGPEVEHAEPDCITNGTCSL